MADFKELLITKDTYNRADLVFKSIEDNFDDSLRNYTEHSRTLKRQLAGLSITLKNIYECSIRMGISATASTGCKDVGDGILDMAESYKKIINNHNLFIDQYTMDVELPIEKLLETETKHVASLRKRWQETYKMNSSEVSKAHSAYEKLTKKDASKKNFNKHSEKIRRALADLENKKNLAGKSVYDMLKQAYEEERSRYCAFMRWQYNYALAAIDYNELTANILKTNISKWQDISMSGSQILPDAAALLTNVCPKRMLIEHGHEMNNLRRETTYDIKLTQTSPDITSGIKSAPSTPRTSLQKSNSVNISTKSPDTNNNLNRGNSLKIPSSPKFAVTSEIETLTIHDDNKYGTVNHLSPNIQSSQSATRSLPPTPPARDYQENVFTEPEKTQNSQNDLERVKYVAKYDWSANEQDKTKLSVKKGETLTAYKISSNQNWIYGNNHAGEFGWFPQSYVQVQTPVATPMKEAQFENKVKENEEKKQEHRDETKSPIKIIQPSISVDNMTFNNSKPSTNDLRAKLMQNLKSRNNGHFERVPEIAVPAFPIPNFSHNQTTRSESVTSLESSSSGSRDY